MGVRLNRSILIARGRNDEASKFAGDVSSYLEELTGIEVTWGVEIGGTVGKIHWYADYENLAALEAAFNHAESDEGYNKLLATGNDLFEGHPEDTWVYTM
jgi:hypothetical protein